MSTAAAQTHAPTLNDKQTKIADYLRDKAEAGKVYFKSKFMADELEMSSKEIGTNMLRLSERCDDLEIEKWSYASATTWRVEPR
ncbi:MAG: DUF7123 family protein [Halobacteriota archaeon]